MFRSVPYFPGLVLIVLVGMGLHTVPAAAADLTVNAPTAYIANDGLCSLVEAIDNANNDAVTHADCPAGSGADTLTLTVPVTLDGTATFTLDGPTGLPIITSPIILEGNDLAISRVGGSPSFRIMAVGAAGNLTLDRVLISGGQLDTGFVDGGGIYVAGNLTLTRSIVQNNTVSGIFPSGGGIFGTNNSQITILDSMVQNNIADNNNAAQVFDDGGGIYTTGSLTLRNATIQGNRAAERGGGVYALGTTTINNSTFADNIATGGGGLLAARGLGVTSITVNNTTFANNTAADGGGAIFNTNNNLTIFGSTFTGNTAQGLNNIGSVADAGGAIFNIGDATVITASFFDGNRAQGIAVGGAIANVTLGSVTLTGSTVRNNSSEGLGGGLYTALAPFIVTDSLISGNTAARGGGLYEGPSNVDGFNVQRSVVRDNTATFVGGGFASESSQSTARFYNSTFTGNSAPFLGGGIGLNSGGQVEVYYTTIAGNSATQFPNSVGGTNFFAGTATIEGTIIANNTNADCSATAGSTSNGFNVSPSPSDIALTRWCSFIPLNPTDQPGTDPLLQATANNGGVDVSYTLDPASPAIDINPASCPATLNGVDQRGVPRPAGSCDAGSISSDPVTLPTVYFRTAQTVINNEGTVTMPQTVELVVDNTAGTFNTPTTVPLTVFVRQQGTATKNQDFTDTLNDQVQFTLSAANFPAPGNISILPLTYTVVDDLVVEPAETILLVASLAGPGILDTTRASHTVQIVDDDVAVAPVTENNNDDVAVAPVTENNNDDDDDAPTPDEGIPAPALGFIGFADAPGAVRWVATVNNPAAQDLSNPTVIFTLPDGLTPSDVIVTDGTVTVVGNTVTVTLGTLAANSTVVITLLTDLTDNAPPEALANTACLGSTGGNLGCVTATVIRALPATGETPLWRLIVLVALGLAGAALIRRAGATAPYHLGRRSRKFL